MKLDKRKRYIVVIDTETCMLNPLEKLSGSNALVYDVGYQVVDKKGNVYVARSFVVDEIFNHEQDRMASAYYAWKLPLYYQAIEDGQTTVASIWDIRKQLREDMESFNCTTICAHNALFDFQALKTTMQYLTHGEIKTFYPYDVELWDSLKMAKDTICKNKTYTYMTKSGKQKSATAENLYRYITQDEFFEEAHTGLKDVEIETVIMAKCLSMHKKMQKNLFKIA